MIVVNNCIIIQSYVPVNKEKQQCVEVVFSHSGSKTTPALQSTVMSSKLPLTFQVSLVTGATSVIFKFVGLKLVSKAVDSNNVR